MKQPDLEGSDEELERWEHRVVRVKRHATLILALSIVGLMVVDSMPTATPQLKAIKAAFAPALNRTGLWQGAWTLFAPNPVINNAWLTVEAVSPSGKRETWNSVFWAETNSWDRFRDYRYLNYYIRLANVNPAAADGFADYMARKLISESAEPVTREDDAFILAEAECPTTWTLTVYRNLMSLSMPEDGSFPSREESIWIASSRHLSIRRYRP